MKKRFLILIAIVIALGQLNAQNVVWPPESIESLTTDVDR